MLLIVGDGISRRKGMLFYKAAAIPQGNLSAIIQMF